MPEPTRSELEALWTAAANQRSDKEAWTATGTLAAKHAQLSALKVFVFQAAQSSNPRLQQLAINILKRAVE